jgi:hypothetical protein
MRETRLLGEYGDWTDDWTTKEMVFISQQM